MWGRVSDPSGPSIARQVFLRYERNSRRHFETGAYRASPIHNG